MGEAMNLGAFKRMLALAGYPQTRILSATWAAKPAASAVQVGQIIQITDYSNRLYISDGAVWRRLGNAPWSQSASPVSVTGTLSETTLATVAVPGGAMGANGGARVSGLFSVTNNANAKALRVRFGGVSYYGPSVTTSLSVPFSFEIWNRGAENSQIGPAVNNTVPLGAAAVAATTSAIDTSAAFNITATAQLANTGDTAILEAFTVELLKP